MPTVGRLTIALGVPLRYYIDDEPATPDEYFAASKAMDRLTGPCLECRRREQERLTPLLREAAASVALDGDTPCCMLYDEETRSCLQCDGDTPPCPQCAAHAKRIAALEAQIAELVNVQQAANRAGSLLCHALEGGQDGYSSTASDMEWRQRVADAYGEREAQG